MEKYKYCNQCKHFINGRIPMCGRYPIKDMVDLVDGGTIRHGIDCQRARSPLFAAELAAAASTILYEFGIPDPCGADGLYWEPKDTE